MYIYLLSRQSAVSGSVEFGCGGSAVGPLDGIHGVRSQDPALRLLFLLLSTAMEPAPAPVHSVRALWASFFLFGTGPVLPVGNDVYQTVPCCGLKRWAVPCRRWGLFQDVARHHSIDIQTPFQAI